MRPCSRLVRTQAMPWPPFTRRQKGWTTSSLRTPSLGGAGGAGRTGMFCSSANPPHPGLVRVGALLEHGRLDAGDPVLRAELIAHGWAELRSNGSAEFGNVAEDRHRHSHAVLPCCCCRCSSAKRGEQGT